MHLISCDNCGLVYDATKIKFPEEIYSDRDEYEIDPKKGMWDSDKECMNAYVKCRCGEPILKPQGL